MGHIKVKFDIVLMKCSKVNEVNQTAVNES